MDTNILSPMALMDRSAGSDDDSDEEFYDKLCKWNIKYEKNEVHAGPCDTNEVDFIEMKKVLILNDLEFGLKFMLSKTAVETLLPKIIHHVTAISSNKVSPLHQLLLTLRFYAVSSIPQTDFLDISKPTATRIIQDISEAISKLDKEYIYMHQGNVEKFQKIASIPRVLGVMDCTTVTLHSPHVVQAKLKICVQAVCDADLRFMKFLVYWPGVPFEFVKLNTALKCCYETNQFILADSKYPCKKYLLPPIQNPSTEAEERYNEAHVKTWKSIERTFAAWKQRFTVIARPVRGNLWNINRVIMATAVLHNICRNQDLEDIPAKIEASDDVEDFDGSDDDDTERMELIKQVFT